MKFCSHCGAAVSLRIPAGDSLPRHVCQSCAAVHYQNPRMVVGCIPEWEDKILLCKRAIEPRHGFWTLPAGFLELGESVQTGAVRETLEEAESRVEIVSLYSCISVPRIHQVHVFFRARMLDMSFGPGTESLEVQLFSETEIPWGDLAFRTVTDTLRHYFADRAARQFGCHVLELA